MPEVRKRLIRPEPWLIMTLRKRKPLFPMLRPFRDPILAFMEDVMRQLRNREAWVTTTAETIRGGIVSGIFERVRKAVVGGK